MIMPNNYQVESATETLTSGLVFDDEPMESLLYGKPGSGPSSASLFATAQSVITSVRQALERADIGEALRVIADFLRGDDPIPEDALAVFVYVILGIIPEVPCPIVKDYGVVYEDILEPIFALSKTHKLNALLDATGTRLYRWYEAGGRFREAAKVISILLDRARQQDDRYHEAMLTNNLGYEYLLAGDWVTAEPYFVHAADLFDQLQCRLDVANARANQLQCRFELNGFMPNDGYEAELQDILQVLDHDWRRRKPLILMARLAKGRGEFNAAIQLAKQAVEASEGMPTQLHFQDQSYLDKLESAAQSDTGKT